MSEEQMKLVEFNVWCRKCKYYTVDAHEPPCDDCLGVPARPNSTRPELYEENDRIKAMRDI